MCSASCRNAFKELKESGYIDELDKTHYLFFEVPKKTLRLKPHEERREFIDEDTGEIHRLTFKELNEIAGDDSLNLW